MIKPKPWATLFHLCVTLPSVLAGEDHRGDAGVAPSSSCKVALCLGRDRMSKPTWDSCCTALDKFRWTFLQLGVAFLPCWCDQWDKEEYLWMCWVALVWNAGHVWMGLHVCLCPAEGPEVTEVEVEDPSASLGPHRNPSTKLHRQNLHCNASKAG